MRASWILLAMAVISIMVFELLPNMLTFVTAMFIGAVSGALAGALAADWFSWRAQGIDPELTSQGALSHAMLALQGQLVAVVLLMGLYLAARTARGLVTRPRNTTFDVISLFLLYTCAQGAALIADAAFDDASRAC